MPCSMPFFRDKSLINNTARMTSFSDLFRVLPTAILLAMLLAISFVWRDAQASVPLNYFIAPGESSFSLTPEQAAWLKKKGTLRVGVGTDLSPVEVVEAGGAFTGLAGDYLQLIARRLDVKLTFVRYDNGETLLRAAERGEIDLLPTVVNTKERERYVAFTRPYLDLPHAIFAHRQTPIFPIKGDWDGVKVVAERGFAVIGHIRKSHPKAKIVLVDDAASALLAVTKREADVYVGSLITSERVFNRLRINNIEIRGEVDTPLKNMRMGVSRNVPSGHTLLADALDQAMSSITADELRAIEARWIAPVNKITYASGGLILSDEQQAWLREHRNIKVAYDPEMYLVSELGDGGRMRGVGVDFLGGAATKLGINVSEEVGGTWPEIIEKARRGEVDVLVAAAKTPERLRDFDFAGPYLVARTVIVDRYDGLAHYRLSDLVGQRVAVVKEHFLLSDIRQRHPAVELVEYNTLLEALEAVERGEATAAIGNIYTMSNLLATRFLGYLRISGHVEGGDSALHFATSAKNPVLGQLLQAGFSSLSEAERNTIRDRWLTVRYVAGISSRNVIFYSTIAAAVVLFILATFWFANRRLRKEIEAHKRTEAMLHHKRAEAEAATMAKARYLATMSHEVRNPLQGVLAAADMLNRTFLNPSQKRMGQIIQEASAYLVQLLNEILDDAKLAEGKISVRASTVDVAKILRSAVSVFEPIAANKGITIDVILPANLAGAYVLDGSLLRQIVSNLVSNAVKFTQTGQVVVRVSVSETTAATQHLMIEVADTGPGMTPSELDRLFGDFVQGEAAKATGDSGSGLGLSIAKRLTDVMGGKLTVASTVGQGTTFCIALDVAIGNVEDLSRYVGMHDAQFGSRGTDLDPKHASTSGSGEAAENSSTAVESRRLRVLLAEDDRLLQMLYEEQFKLLGHDVLVVDDAESAIEAWRSHQFDLLVTDNSLGGMSGTQMVEIVRAEERKQLRSPMPILGISGTILPTDRDLGLLVGMNEMLQKPVSIDDLRAAIARVVGS